VRSVKKEPISMNAPQKEQDSRAIDPESWVDRYGDYLYAFTLSRLVDRTTAEDLVQETFVSALHTMKNFKGRSSERTWLTSILKHKILDHFRKKQREKSPHDLGVPQDNVQHFFDEKGHWKEGPGKWDTNPKKLLEQKEFLRILQSCLEGLSSRVATTFVLREIDGLNTDEICKVLNISATNCWVILHRARMLLRRCLELNWFDSGPDGVS
jgi:RNA polymerase sigma-70 factor (TIGR02943 family)